MDAWRLIVRDGRGLLISVEVADSIEMNVMREGLVKFSILGLGLGLSAKREEFGHALGTEVEIAKLVNLHEPFRDRGINLSRSKRSPGVVTYHVLRSFFSRNQAVEGAALQVQPVTPNNELIATRVSFH